MNLMKRRWRKISLILALFPIVAILILTMLLLAGMNPVDLMITWYPLIVAVALVVGLLEIFAAWRASR